MYIYIREREREGSGRYSSGFGSTHLGDPESRVFNLNLGLAWDIRSATFDPPNLINSKSSLRKTPKSVKSKAGLSF